jgi:hypothetical protein
MGADGIPAVVLKECATVLAPCLSVISDRCLAEGEFPSRWKEAIVVPVPKVPSSQKASDYRPISLLPLMSKLVESHINQMLMSQINHKISNAQFGFRQGRSTVDAILSFQHYVLRGFQKCEMSKVPTRVVAIFFDMAKAFDTVSHVNLLRCLSETYKMPRPLSQVIESYLSMRTMRVKVEDSLSKSVSIPSGVPQGSVVGPSLFIAFIDALAQLNLSCEANIILYADDIVLIHPLLTDASIQQLQEDIDKIGKSTETLGLQLNVSKCNFVLLSLSKTQTSPVKLFLNGQALKQVPSYKYLGVEIEEKFNFSRQTMITTMNAKRGIGALNRALRKWAPATILNTAITSIVLPALHYAIEVWYPPNECHQRQLEKVIKFAARLVLNDFKRESTYEELLGRLNWKPMSRIVAERRLICVAKYLDGTRFVPTDILVLQPPSTNRCSQRIGTKRKTHRLQLVVNRSQKNSLEEKLAIEKMKVLWNALPEEVVFLPFSTFRERVYNENVHEVLTAAGVLLIVKGV